jgi:hypothetical protein
MSDKKAVSNTNDFLYKQLYYPTRMKLWNPDVQIYNKSAEINMNLLIKAIEYVESK